MPTLSDNNILRKKEIKDKIGNDKLYISVQLKGNLFVMTHPKKGETDNCEIEDLFDEVLLDIILDGKSFQEMKITIRKPILENMIFLCMY